MLFDDVAAALPGLRAEAERGMVDAVTIERQRVDGNGDPVTDLDPETLAEVPVFDAVHSGKARVQRGISQGHEPVSGGVEFGVYRLEVQLPIAVVGVRPGDRVTVTAATFDPDLVGKVATVRAVPDKTHATKRSLMCEEV